MKVTGWTWWENPDYKDMSPIGGPFPFEDQWEEVLDVVAKELRDRGYKFTGDYHQNGDYGAPVIDGEWLFMVTQRSWGHIMVRAYPDEIYNGDNLGYCKWAWSAPEDSVLPRLEDYTDGHQPLQH